MPTLCRRIPFLLPVLLLVAGPLPAIGATATATDAWTIIGNGDDQQYYSPLKQINDANVGRLGLAWYADMPAQDGLVGNVLVQDGIAYQSGAFSRVYANDARTGKLLWRHDAKAPEAAGAKLAKTAKAAITGADVLFKVRAPEAAEIAALKSGAIVAAALNARQVVLALSGGELKVFEYDDASRSPVERASKALGAEVLALALPPLAAGRLRAPLVVGLERAEGRAASSGAADSGDSGASSGAPASDLEEDVSDIPVLAAASSSC